MRLLGVDPGERRIGLAVSDPEGKVATPVGVIDRQVVADAAGAVLARARELGAEGIVVGMPVTLRGEVGPAAERVGQFVEELKGSGELPVTVYDERLTTAAAERAMLEAGASRRARRESLDKVAAALILQAYLDRQAVGGGESYRQ